MDKTETLRKLISQSKKICVFTGAGISCPSGIPDFRSSDGLYSEKDKSGYSPETIISHSFFVSHTEEFYEFYKDKMIYPKALPNSAHIFFAELEKMGWDVSIVTQNIDGLHTKAGSRKVFEIHGSIHRNYCTKCKRMYDADYIINSAGVPLCENDLSIIKPDVVLYEEPLDEKTVDGAVKAIAGADLQIVIGTSLSVYPAASFLRYFTGKDIVVINKEKTNSNIHFSLEINDDIINVIDKLNEKKICKETQG